MWSNIQTTRFTRPVTFSGDARDLKLLEACKEIKDESFEVPAEEAPAEAGKLTYYLS